MEREKEKVRARVLMLQHHFAAKKAGLDAVLDEVADMVRRNTQVSPGRPYTVERI